MSFKLLLFFLFFGINHFYAQIQKSDSCIGKTISYVDQDYRLTYRGSMYEIRKQVLSNYNDSLYFQTPNSSGIITIQFYINCKGEMVDLSSQACDLNYQTIEFNPEILKEILLLTSKLKDWNPNFLKNQSIAKQYAFLSFKLKEGIIIEIMPFY